MKRREPQLALEYKIVKICSSLFFIYACLPRSIVLPILSCKIEWALFHCLCLVMGLLEEGIHLFQHASLYLHESCVHSHLHVLTTLLLGTLTLLVGTKTS